MSRIVCAMSGGVDSSVAAALLVQQGHEVIGITLRLWPEQQDGTESGCCGLSAVEDARRVASALGIRFHVKDEQALFEEQVVRPFVDEYGRGRTPNPCIRCNRYIKFASLLQFADQLGADALATGHYARIGFDDTRQRWTLARGAARVKDQTYALHTLTQDQLSRTIFPLGDMEGKEDVREMATSLGLRVASKRDSQDICFVPDNDYRKFLSAYAPDMNRPGEIIDETGVVKGEHSGITYYTRGQRKGIGAQGPVPRYVVDLDGPRNRVVIGPDSSLWSRLFGIEDMNWVSYAGPEECREPLTCKVRYNMTDKPCRLESHDGAMTGIFEEPQRAITPGQSAVFYAGDVVVGGGIVARNLPAEP